ncbi:hypothetical protein CRG98_028866 [Punica granatum]|uniref:Uncharacterized protein n=1 Tax=Punica granatum TaxID=22663 RepID=A0A2I0J3C0_PUNGR|nr:hypothetical protein CRG98_028866 [Punica granatum]
MGSARGLARRAPVRAKDRRKGEAYLNRMWAKNKSRRGLVTALSEEDNGEAPPLPPTLLLRPSIATVPVASLTSPPTATSIIPSGSLKATKSESTSKKPDWGGIWFGHEPKARDLRPTFTQGSRETRVGQDLRFDPTHTSRALTRLRRGSRELKLERKRRAHGSRVWVHPNRWLTTPGLGSRTRGDLTHWDHDSRLPREAEQWMSMSVRATAHIRRKRLTMIFFYNIVIF